MDYSNKLLYEATLEDLFDEIKKRYDTLGTFTHRNGQFNVVVQGEIGMIIEGAVHIINSVCELYNIGLDADDLEEIMRNIKSNPTDKKEDR